MASMVRGPLTFIRSKLFASSSLDMILISPHLCQEPSLLFSFKVVSYGLGRRTLGGEKEGGPGKKPQNEPSRGVRWFLGTRSPLAFLKQQVTILSPRGLGARFDFGRGRRLRCVTF